MPPLPPSQDPSLQPLLSSLQSKHSLPCSPDWLANTIPSSTLSSRPLASLLSTALFRLLASDFTVSLSPGPGPSAAFGPNTTDASVKKAVVEGDVAAQVLGVWDVGRSGWQQVLEAEAAEAGEARVGREVVRTLPVAAVGVGEQGAGVGQGEAKGRGPHRYVLQDGNGRKVVAVEVEGVIEKMGLNVAIGAKVVVKKGAEVRRGLVLLKRGDVVVLGGRVEGWDEKWKKGWRERLVAGIEGREES